MTVKPLDQGATIGIIGGGQLGRMLAAAAARLGFKTIVLEPQADCPAAQLCTRQIVAAYDDPDALAALAQQCDVITYEFENVDVAAIEQLEAVARVYPPSKPLAVAQDRAVEKTFLAEAGLTTAPWQAVDTAADLDKALAAFGGKAILKTRRMGYDGKGQVRFSGAQSDPTSDEALTLVGHAPCVLEGFVDFTAEISVIGTRAINGSTTCFDPAANVHEAGILSTSTLPSGLDPAIEAQATELTAKLLNALSYVGTLGLEFFVTRQGTLIANEFAPRVHNSGHWTEAACAVSQFEQHIRAIAGWPLGDAKRHSDCVMHNLLGDAIDELPYLAQQPDVFLHSYGKAEARPGRKMGHYTRISPRKSA
ncbi:MAG: 5-(carboxyamino)imidazole ribonucleotide synthase [Ahrensia sp.]